MKAIEATFRLLQVLIVLFAGLGQAKALEKRDFPEDFIFGAGTSAYQIEGGATEDGKGPSIWDTFTHKFPDKIDGGNNGDMAVDSYHRYKEDIQLGKEMGLDAYRFSISWTRILPKGKLRGGVSKEGIKHYNNLINELIDNGMMPLVTLFHWDLPQYLEDEYGGFLSSKIVVDFEDYANICFQEFGDRVKYWVTVNEPWTYSVRGYDLGISAPAHCSPSLGNCTQGNSATEPYQVAHNMLLAHAAAFSLYKDKYEAAQKGVIGISLSAHWYLPYSNTNGDHEAAYRAVDFMLGWALDPITRGDYPFSMRTYVGERLPRFTENQSHNLRGSFDFIGINYYTTHYASDIPYSSFSKAVSYSNDIHVDRTGMRNGIPIGPQGASTWLFVYPPGIKDLLVYIKERYNNPTIYITENGVDEYDNGTKPLEESLQDTIRKDCHYNHLLHIREAIRRGVRVKGYFFWSLLDNFEWEDGYSLRFGLYYVDYKNNLRRLPKLSARFFSRFLREKTTSLEEADLINTM
ncbi:beta-glucosidase 12 [Amborella trichopoda]|uniref:Beta-glucosidase n=1 Tax=Amborella trichopoda TaxID=13333 RepID=W1PH07_AMBTC|nr:beta-glucosidase 12 [Amborella trichopoda]ERN09277.1 hypothetical protein AMTR_s00149p00064300 [Amborella trichopoda]|eukprot:XP_006847696.1 beta-glucosidase 12 [Amborella trichopoda]